MTPQDTHYDSLSIYYDFLEENGYETEELREFTGNQTWHWVRGYDAVGNDLTILLGSVVGGRSGCANIYFNDVGVPNFYHCVSGIGTSSVGG